MVPALVRYPLLALARRLGYDVYRINRERSLYGQVVPGANYSPWNLDLPFLACWDRIKGVTLVDIMRCHELWSLVAEVKGLPGDLLEVGVWRGGTGALLASKAMAEGIDATVHLCDTFAGVVKAGAGDTHYVGGEHADTSLQQVQSLVQQMGLHNVRLHPGVFPEDTGAALSRSTFRLCHIDVDVYRSGLDVLNWVWPRLVVGGVVVFDDYGTDSTPGITTLVNEQRGLEGRLIVHNLNGHGLIIKTAAGLR
jgi:O-methyltransferase